jgi:hypothetical protein
MPRPRPDRILRRALTDLARLHPEDLAMILDALEPAERARIERLTAELGERPTAAEAPEAEPVWTYEGVSPWLRVRIDPNAKAGRAHREFVLMTDAARTALVAAAEPCKARRTASGPGRSLASRIWEKLGGAPA